MAYKEGKITAERGDKKRNQIICCDIVDANATKPDMVR